MPSGTSTSGDVYGGFTIHLKRSLIDDNGRLPREDWQIEGILNSICQDYRSVVDAATNRMKVNPRFVVEVYTDYLKIILVADWEGQHAALAWNTENYAEVRFREAAEKAIKQAIRSWVSKDYGQAFCADHTGTVWRESL